MKNIVATHYRCKRPLRKKPSAAAALKAPTIVTVTSKKRLQRKAADPAPDRPTIIQVDSERQRKWRRLAGRESPSETEVSPEVRAFFDRMVRPGGALPPDKSPIAPTSRKSSIASKVKQSRGA